MREGLIHFFRIQAAMAEQFPCKYQYRNLVSVARPRLRIQIDVDDIDGDSLRRRQSMKLAQHLFAQAAAGAGVQQEPLGVNDGESRRRWKFSRSER